ncbi:MAG: type VI secretion system baseplate subunit TssK [Planctomycetota bacterium]|jgi:type VI secretion system protein ImpJ|nr:type VI secretion system baseplate subunit TssK [Planctomycetota bacterium]
MDLSCPVFWHHGLFLQPQHFQLNDLYEAARHAPFLQFLQPHFWGVGHLAIRTDWLATGSFGLSEGSFLFPGGTFARFPGNAVLPARSFLADWASGDGPFTVYLGLRRWNPVAANVTVVDDVESADAPTRLAVASDAETMNDWYGGGPEAQVRRMKFSLRLLWQTEEQALNDYEVIPLAQLVRSGKEIRVGARFIPPAVSCGATPELTGMLRQVHDMVAGRCRLFEERKPRRGMKNAAFASADLLQVMGMQALAEAVPQLAQLLAAPDIHPWHLYTALATLCGRLSVFSDYVFASGEDATGERRLPAYDHRNLYDTFNAAQRVLAVLLDELILSSESVVGLKPMSDGIYAAALSEEMTDAQGNYFLIVRTAAAKELVRDAFMTVVKVAAAGRIEDLRTRFVSGARLTEIPYPPQGVPRLTDAVYFYLEPRNAEWQEALRDGTVALYWDGSPEDLSVELALQSNG